MKAPGGGQGDKATEKELGSSTQARGLPSCGNPTSRTMTALEKAGDRELVDSGKVRSLDLESQAPRASCLSELISLST